MAFNSYITLDGYRYKTTAKQWKPTTIRPATPRLTLQGNMEATFGTGCLVRWQGQIVAAHSDSMPPGSPGIGLDGNIVSLRASLKKASTLSFTDHYGVTYDTVAQGPFDEYSLVNVWNSTSNRYYVTVTLTAKG